MSQPSDSGDELLDLELLAGETPEGPSPEVGFLDKALADAASQNASHVHIGSAGDDVVVRFRVDGKDREAARAAVDLRAIMVRLRIMAGVPIVPRTTGQCGVITFDGSGAVVWFALQLLPGVAGEKAVLEMLTEERFDPVSLDDLGMLDSQLAALGAALGRRGGVILLGGITGSGVNTTAYASLLEIDGKARSAASIEAPPLGRLPGVQQILARHSDERNARMAELMRSDIDVIYYRELMGAESVNLVLTAAVEHDKLVLASIHSRDAASALTMMMDMGADPALVASGVTLVQAQRLLRRLCAECRVREPEAVLAAPVVAHHAVGCDACVGTGYTDGHILVCETMPVTDALRRLVADGASADAIKEAAVREGMTDMRTMGLGLTYEGATSLEQVNSIAR